MEIVDKRSSEGLKPEIEAVEINGNVEGFQPAPNRVLIKRLPPPPEGIIARPEIMQEQAERGTVIAVGGSETPAPPVGAIAKFSKYTEEIHFDDEGADSYVLPYVQDIRGWHNA
jgi:hypothetical protein